MIEVHLRLPVELHAELKRLAQEKGERMSTLIRMILSQAVEKEKGA